MVKFGLIRAVLWIVAVEKRGIWSIEKQMKKMKKKETAINGMQENV